MPSWTDYLSHASRRLGKISQETDKSRTVFQRDYDRIIFFDAFRRLQNKTQVLPVPKSDEVRNRLTHSLETASVGRSLGFLAGQFLLKKYPALSGGLHFRPEDFGHMVSAAALTHDIGNPPFGHEGEKAVQQFFHSPKAEKYLQNLNPKQIEDFRRFEGNAAGFRILAHTHGNSPRIQGGLRLSLGTYGAFVKYPREVAFHPEKTKNASQKKYGIFQAELPVFEQIAKQLHLIEQHSSEYRAWKRFPLAFLTEAADDICYSIIDYEDAFHLGFIDEKTVREKLEELAALTKEQNEIYRQIPGSKQQIAYLRSYAINRLINETVEIFKDREEEIREGTFDTALTSRLPKEINELLQQIKKESREKYYNHPSVLKNEAGGKTVLPFLLEKFLAAQFDPDNHKQYARLMPEIYRQSTSDYDKILDTVMFVTGMSDRQAVDWFRNFNGIQLVEY